MRKIIAKILAACLLISLTGCFASPEETTPPTIPTVQTMPPLTEPAETIQPTTAATTAETTEPTEATLAPIVEASEEKRPFVQLSQWIPDARQDLVLARRDNGERAVYDFSEAWLRLGTAEKLKQANELLQTQGLTLLIWDAYRTCEDQAVLSALRPEYSEDDNCRGSAVDVSLVSLETGEPVAMPSGYLDLTAAADRDYSDCSAEAYSNATFLQVTMERCGFHSDESFWWRYLDEEGYPVEEMLDPVALSQWFLDGAEGVSLLESPREDAAVMAQIPAGGEVTLLAYYGDYALVRWEEQQGYLPARSIQPLPPSLWTQNFKYNIMLYRRSDVGSKSLAEIKAGDTFTFLEWDFKFAKVKFGYKTGYVRAHYIKIADEAYMANTLDTVNVTDTYSYEQMIADAEWIAQSYPELVTRDSIGQSELGRDIPVLRIGSESAQHHVLIHGAIHGREHMTAWLVMALTDYWVDHNVTAYGDVCFHMIPMVNPDGVIISQTRELTEEQKDYYLRDYYVGNTSDSQKNYAKNWKANALGVDLNQNFAANWEEAAARSKPSNMRYKGESVFCAAEARALRDYTLAYDFDVTISYHSEGSIIYYEYGEKEPVNSLSKSLALAVGEMAGYELRESRSCGGYKDWAMDALGIPSLTIEVGTTEPPLEERDIYGIFCRNLRVLPVVLQWIQEQSRT